MAPPLPRRTTSAHSILFPRRSPRPRSNNGTTGCLVGVRYGMAERVVGIRVTMRKSNVQEIPMKLRHRAAVIAMLTFAVAILTLFTARLSSDSGHRIAQAESAVSGVHDFDFLVGSWRVHHRKLKQRLVNNHDWVEFEGTLVMRKVMDGYSNVDDDVFEVPGGAYRGVALRSFDTKTQQWSIWWLDSRTPQGPLDPPVRGSFQRRCRNVLRGRHMGGQAGPHPIYLVQDHSNVMSMGASLLDRQRRHLGNQLGARHPKSSVIDTTDAT